MKHYFVKTPLLAKLIFNKWKWSFTKKEKTLYLTFDDGPTSEVTNWVLEQLLKHNAKATFFCIGKNIQQNPELFSEIVNQGHTVGNHTNNHLKSFETSKEKYIQNVLEAEQEIKKIINLSTTQKSKLFRPPYGKLKLSQSKILRKKGYKIIMWDVLSADFDTEISKEICMHNVVKNTSKGSIIVFHDSIKAFEKVKFVLPHILEYFSEKGYNFKAIA